MLHALRWLLGSLALAGAAATSNLAMAADGRDPQGPYPQYRILRAPAVMTPRGYVYYPGQQEEVRAPAYAWGWFGARASQPAATHRGYYGERWIWGR